MPGVFKKIRFYVRWLTAFWKTHKITIFLAFTFSLAVFTGATFLTKKLSIIRSEKIGIVGKYTPENLPFEVAAKISQGLTKINKNGLVEPLIAQKWEVLDNGKIYRFTLGDNLFWHDGFPVNALDLEYNFSDVSVKKIDEKTIEFELKESFSPFPAVLEKPVFKKGLIGVGDWEVKSVIRNGQIIEKLTLKSLDGQGVIHYHFYPTQMTAITAFKLGEIDILQGVNQLDDLEEWPGIKIESLETPNQLVALIINSQGLFGDKSLRQALAYAVNKDWPHRAYGPINPQSWAYNANLKSYDYDIQKARELMDNGLGDEDLEEITLTTFPNLISTAEKIVGDWQELGLKLKIEVVNVIPQNFQILLVLEDIPSDPDQYLLWHSTQPSNLSRYKSPQIDKLLEDGRKTMDQEERKNIYLDFQRFLVEDAPVIFLYHPITYAISRVKS